VVVEARVNDIVAIAAEVISVKKKRSVSIESIASRFIAYF